MAIGDGPSRALERYGLSLSTKLRMGEGIDEDDLEGLRGALRDAERAYRDSDHVPKRVAALLLDLAPSIEATMGFHDEATAERISLVADEIADLARSIVAVPGEGDEEEP